MSGSHVRGHRLSGHKRQRIDEVRNDINVTPLVDVVLVVLIIFMVMAPLMARGREVPNLPKTRNHSQEKDKLQPVVAVDKDGTLWFDKEKLGPVDDANLKRMGEEILRAWQAPKNPEGSGRIYLKAAGDLNFAQVRPVIMYLNENPDLKLESIDLATNEIKEN